MKIRWRRIIEVSLLVIIMITSVYWYLFVPTSTARIRAARLAITAMPGAIHRELTVDFRGMNLAVANFYLSAQRMPTPEEIKELDMKSLGEEGLLWDKYGTNRFGNENYYNSGYENGECTFMVEAAFSNVQFDEHFQEDYLPIINRTMTDLEHMWILQSPESRKENDAPEIFWFDRFLVSPACIQLLEDMSWRKPEKYEEIRNEILRQLEEGTYDENICVLSLPFQRRLARRKESDTASAAESAYTSPGQGP